MSGQPAGTVTACVFPRAGSPAISRQAAKARTAATKAARPDAKGRFGNEIAAPAARTRAWVRVRYGVPGRSIR